jgi:bifunctional DNase/RNase
VEPGLSAADPTTPIRVELSRILIREMADMQVVELRDVATGRSFPIVIGLPEAYAIERRLRGEEPERPQTHDLLDRVITELGARIARVDIIDLREGTFHAVLTLDTERGPVALDCRPSDALALCADGRAEIWVAASVIERASSGTPPQAFPFVADEDDDHDD